MESIELEPDEITSWAYISTEELFVMTEPALSRRVSAALEARKAGTTRYLENGVLSDSD